MSLKDYALLLFIFVMYTVKITSIMIGLFEYMQKYIFKKTFIDC